MEYLPYEKAARTILGLELEESPQFMKASKEVQDEIVDSCYNHFLSTDYTSIVGTAVRVCEALENDVTTEELLEDFDEVISTRMSDWR